MRVVTVGSNLAYLTARVEQISHHAVKLVNVPAHVMAEQRLKLYENASKVGMKPLDYIQSRHDMLADKFDSAEQDYESLKMSVPALFYSTLTSAACSSRMVFDSYYPIPIIFGLVYVVDRYSSNIEARKELASIIPDLAVTSSLLDNHQ
jgi:hypothetical protein